MNEDRQCVQEAVSVTQELAGLLEYLQKIEGYLGNTNSRMEYKIAGPRPERTSNVPGEELSDCKAPCDTYLLSIIGKIRMATNRISDHADKASMLADMM